MKLQQPYYGIKTEDNMDENFETNAEGDRVLGRIISDLEIVTRISDCLNIAIIGKTGSGKSSFLNAFRGISNNEVNAARVSANAEGCPVHIEEAKFQHIIKKENIEYLINFFDTIGFQDSNNTNIEKFLNELKKFHNIDEFDALIFVTNGRLSGQELETALLNEKKKVMLFFVYNQVDNFYRSQLTLECLIDDDLPFRDQVIKHREMLENKTNDIQKDICDLINRDQVFGSLFSEIEKFSSNNLKREEYKKKLIEESVYCITSSAKYLEDELYSRDGSRLKKEIEEHLVRTKFNNMNINLLEPFSKRTIYLKKKSILENLFNSKKLKIAGASLTSVIPFLDILPTSRINKSYKQEFFEKFGMKELKDKMRTNPNVISDSEKIQKINKIFKEIDNDGTIKNLDSLLDNSNITDINGLREKIKYFINSILPSIGITAASLTDDFVAKIAGFTLTVTTKSLIVLSLVSIPISIAIFLFLLKRGVEKILLNDFYQLIFELDGLNPDMRKRQTKKRDSPVILLIIETIEIVKCGQQKITKHFAHLLTISVVFCRLLLGPGTDSSTSKIKFSSGSLRSDVKKTNYKQ
ncbi:interferon-inducible GTPase -like protein [Brachionus plicatilis]|uniref:Interferon-inducible GTPase-like protein n=1 Tax=Brachionus plicatilis TaxID=10195 RepID=A0A3M7S0H3_BRAPC|nr:interferon-inducible GTPase -like protein [Brachionus plicatilis]